MKKINTALQPFAHCLFIITIPLYTVLDGNNKFWKLISFESNVRVFFGITAISALVLIFLKRYLDIYKSIVLLSWAMLHYLFFKPIMKFISALPYLSALQNYKLYLPVLLILTIAFFAGLLKMKKYTAVKTSLFINTLFLLFVSIELFKAADNHFKPHPPFISTKKIDLIPFSKNEKSDIYLFVLDEYAGTKSLNEYYGFDNADFLNELKKRGFFIPKNPTSNYNGTVFSVMSLLNMEYLQNLRKDDLKQGKSYGQAAFGIAQNQLTTFLKTNGYTLVNNSFFKIDNCVSDPVLFLPIDSRLITNNSLGNTLENILFMNIPSNKIQRLVGSYYSKIDDYNQRTIQQLESSKRNSKDPVFVYTHLFMPHIPYLRNRDGSLRDMNVAHEDKGKIVDTLYINYLLYCNKIMINLIDLIQKKSNSIIVILSDHGNRFNKNKWKLSNDFNIFFSIYFADGNYNGFTDSLSSVNTFRLILNSHFNQQLPALKNSCFDVAEGILH
jgi:hypothetical protein